MVTSDFEVSQGQITELSSDELEAISGGLINASFTLMITQDSDMTQRSGDGHSSMVSGQRRRSRFGLQFSGSFESMSHFSSFLSRFTNGFGR